MAIYKKYSLSRRRFLISLLIVALVYWVLHLQLPMKLRQEFTSDNLDSSTILELKLLINYSSLQRDETGNIGSKHALFGDKCKIRDLKPFDPDIMPFFDPKEYIKCRDKDLLTYVKKENDTSYLSVDIRFVKQYTNKTVHCCSRTIIRNKRFLGSHTPDTSITLSSCTDFNTSTVIQNSVLVTCKDDSSKEIYKNVHATTTKTEEVKKKVERFGLPRREHLSVLIVGIDSISRGNLIRSLPFTYLHLKRNSWLEFKGYNKIGDNTFPNVMGILTGLNETMAYQICNPTLIGPLDRCKLLWYDYRRLGFITAYGEDESGIGTFSHLGGGFNYEPTDYYFKPYIIASERYLKWKIVDTKKYCTGPETAAERIFNLARDFAETFRDYPNFGLFWMNSYSHNDINSVSRMDDRIYEFLEDLDRSNILENTFVLFLSDHGFRFGPVTYKNAGMMEERAPFFFMLVPRWFKNKYSKKYSNLLKNTKRLTTPYDIYMTLQEILVLSGRNYKIKNGSGCPKCKSLFEEIDKERSCEDAGVKRHWCNCFDCLPIRSPSSHAISLKAAKFIVNRILEMIKLARHKHSRCSRFILEKIISACIWEDNYSMQESLSYILLTLKTRPEAVFQATVSINMSEENPIFRLEGTISRLDEYDKFSWCVDDTLLRRYCYCKTTITNRIWWHIEKVATIFSIVV